MKKKILSILITIFLLSVTVFTLTACGGDDNGNGNEDNSTHVCEYTKTVIPPTCDTQGYTLNECSCGKNYKESFVYALGHVSTPAVKENEVLATCTTGGSYDSVVYCNTCGEEYSRTKINTSKLGHDFVNYVSNNDATVEADGTKTAKCERLGCNATDTVTDVGSKLVAQGLTFKTFTVADNTATGRVSSATSKFNFNNEITTSANYNYIVSLNNNGTSQVLNKEVDLVFGNNVFYVFLMNGYNVEKTYTVSIYRLSSYKVSFNSKISGVTIPTQTIEEGDLAVKPEIAEKAGYGAFYDFDFNTPITKNETVTIEYKAIFNLSSGSITGLTTYGETLNAITIPEKIDGVTITSIGEEAFYNCDNLTSVTIGNSVTSIGDSAFRDCNNLTSVTIPNSVESIGNSAFEDCTNLTSATIPNSVESIGERAFFGCANLTSVTIPNSVESIGNSAFRDCNNLTSATIPNSVTSIGDYAFIWCDNLEKVYYLGDINGWVQIEFSDYGSNPLFNDKAGLYINNELVTTANITTATKINDYSFYFYNKLTSITIPNSVTSIGESAFNNCTNLTSVTIGNSVESIGYYAFIDCTNLTSVIIGDNVKSIGQQAFYNCTNLTNVTIGNSVTSIGSCAFSWCNNLTSLVIPNSVTSIGDHVFSNCANIEKVYYLGDINSWVQIEFSDYGSNPLFNDKAGLYINNKLVTTANITTATKISKYAFYYYNKLTSVTIGNNVTSIGDFAFYYCTNLTSITYNGTKSEWNSISKGSYWNSNVPATYVTCTDGTVTI